MSRLNDKLVKRALGNVEANLGAVSVLRALAAQGVPERLAGEWLGEGRALLERGLHPDRVRCAGATCEATLDESEVSRRAGRFLPRGLGREKAAAGEGPECPECGSTSWVAPTPREVSLMKLALADTRVGLDTLALTGQASRRILQADATLAEHKHLAAPQVTLVKHYQQSLDPQRFGERSTLRLEGSVNVTAQEWARGIPQHDAERLSPAAVKHLQQIAEVQRALDEEARRLVEADLAGEEYVPVLPLVSLPALAGASIIAATAR